MKLVFLLFLIGSIDAKCLELPSNCTNDWIETAIYYLQVTLPKGAYCGDQKITEWVVILEALFNKDRPGIVDDFRVSMFFWFPFGLFLLVCGFWTGTLVRRNFPRWQLTQISSANWLAGVNHLPYPSYFFTSALSNCRFGHLTFHNHLNNSEEDWRAAWKKLIPPVGIEPQSKRPKFSKLRFNQLRYQGSSILMIFKFSKLYHICGLSTLVNYFTSINFCQ